MARRFFNYRTGDGKGGKATAAGILAMLRRGRRVTAWTPRVKSARARVLEVASSQVGVIEQPRGSNSGENVERYQQSTTVPGTRWPWCMAFVVWCCTKAGVEIGYRGAYVPDFERWAKDHGRWHAGASLPRAWRNKLVAVVMEFNGDGVADHVGLLEHHGSPIRTIEGNTSGEGLAGSQSNGDGVHRRRRTPGVIRGYVLIAN